MNPTSTASSAPTAPAPGRWRRFLDSDLWYSFRTSPVAMAAALIAFVCIFCAVFAGWVAPHNPFDLATLELGDSRLPPAWLEGASGPTSSAPMTRGATFFPR